MDHINGPRNWKILVCSIFLIQSTASFTYAPKGVGKIAPLRAESSSVCEDKLQDESRGTFAPFVAYAWKRLLSSGLVDESSIPVPEHLAFKSSPARGFPDGSTVDIEVKSATPLETNANEISPLRLARYALLETLTPDVEDPKQMISVPNAIQVLNLVLFPDVSLALPVLGMDLVTLPGNKSLIAIDFQPILPPVPSSGDVGEEEHAPLFPEDYAQYEQRIKALHEKHVLNQSEVLPWGGDIPPQAKRFFSPYALWTRLQGEGALCTLQNEVFDAFCDYFDLYLEIMQSCQSSISSVSSIESNEIKEGHIDYLNYRRDNDPARPMLKRLYGEDYTEEVITNILFKMI